MTDNRAYAKHLLTALYDLLIEFLDEAPAAAKPRLDSLLNEEPIFAKPDTCAAVNPDTGHSCQRLPGHTQYAAQHFGPDDEYWTDTVSAPEPESEEANLRVGWASAPGLPPRLVREIRGGWTHLRTDDGPVWGSHESGIVFTPLTPADFGWTVLGEGQVAVDMRPGWRGSTPADWRKEAEILRKERPDALAAAALCEQFADALDGES